MRIDEGEYDKYEKGTKKGVTKSQLNELESIRNNCSEKHKVRNDAGRTIFYSPEMREMTYTPYNHFKKLQRKNNPGVTILDKELKEAYDKLD